MIPTSAVWDGLKGEVGWDVILTMEGGGWEDCRGGVANGNVNAVAEENEEEEDLVVVIVIRSMVPRMYKDTHRR